MNINVNGHNLLDTVINNEIRITALERIVAVLINNGGRITQAEHDSIQKQAEQQIRQKYGL